MRPEALPWLALCALSCAGLLASERRGWRAGVWLTKPLASAACVATALASGGLETGYGRRVVLALALSWWGDLLLIPAGVGAAFLLGMGSFLAAHLAYAAAFLGADPPAAPVALAAAALAPVWLATWRWLRPHLEGPLRLAVPLYAAAIGAMVALAAGAATSLSRPGLFAGALLFAVSDLSVARDRLVAPAFAHVAWGLPAYFAAQLLLALSVGSG